MATKLAGSDETVAEVFREKILTIGENIKIRRFARWKVIWFLMFTAAENGCYGDI